MKYLFVAVLGLAVGAAGAGAVVYFNPFSAATASTRPPADRVLHYALPDSVLQLALGDDARLFGDIDAENLLWEETIDRAAVLGLVLNDADNQPAAIASRLIAVSSDTDLLLQGMLLDDYWLITTPGEGTLFVEADSNAWPFVKESLLPVWYLERPWQGPSEYWPTVGPSSDSTGVALGVAGAFHGAGRAVERLEVTVLDPARRAAVARGELHLDLPDTQVAQQ
jgi:hypothetical protein